MADLAGDEAGVLVSTSDLYVYSLRVSDGTLQWRHSLLEAAYIGGERIPADMVATAADFQSSPTVVDGIVYVGAPNRFVYAVDAGSGREVWRFETSGHVAATPAVAEGRVYFGSEGGDKQFYAVDAKTGHPVWKRSLGWVWAGAGYAAGKLFVGTGEGDIVGLRAATGDILWKRETTGPIYTTPATDATSAYTGGFGGHYYALDQQTGDMRWAHFIPSGQYAAHPLTPDSNAPVVLGDRLFSAVGSSVFALDTKTGRRVWDQPIGSGGMDVTPAADGRQLVVSDIKWETNGANIGDTRLVSLDIKTGKVLWQYSPGGGLTGAVFARDRLFFASTSNPHVACVLAKPEPNSVPQLLWRYKLGGVVEESNPAIYGNRLYVLAADRYLYALE
jgi:outer membrane protein assembly factor BamB